MEKEKQTTVEVDKEQLEKMIKAIEEFDCSDRRAEQNDQTQGRDY